VIPHAAVHRGGHQHRTPRGQEQRGQKVVGDTVRGAGQEVGGGRCDHEGVGTLGQGHVLDRLRALRIEQIGEHRAAGERPEGEGTDELVRVRGGDHRDPGAQTRELAQQVDRLEGGDAAGDAEDQVFVV